jgi:DNA mismatch endonuclease Vsr
MDNLTPDQRRKNMRHIKSKYSVAERLVMNGISEHGIFFVKHLKKLPGKPDLVFRRVRLAVFIDSEFWHMHPEKCVMPKSNYEYWLKKLQGNRQRDIEVTALLQSNGWRVVRYWEFEVKKNPSRVVFEILQQALPPDKFASINLRPVEQVF